MTAFEELVEWCDKHLPVGSYQIVPESNAFVQTIYFNVTEDEHPFICFETKGYVSNIGTLTNDDMLEHIRDLEVTERQRGTISYDK